jgi:chitodextrinase
MISKKLLLIVMVGLLSGLLNACSGTGETSNNTAPPSVPDTNTDTIAPSKPTNLHTTALLPASVVLAWDASTDDTLVAGYRVYKNSLLVTSIATTTYADNSVTSNTAYQYAVVAYDASGNETMSDSLSVTTPITTDTVAPTAPTNLRSTATSSNSISLAWNASTDNVTVTGYRVYRGTSLLVTTTSLIYTNTGLTANTSYQYHVDAVDAAGNIASSSTLTVSTATDTTPPTAPGNLRSTTITSSSIGIAWNVSTDNVGIAYYRVYRNSVQISQTTSTTYTDTALAAATNYSYTVRAYDAAGNNTISSTLPVATASISNTATASLSWIPPTQNSDDSTLTNLSGYIVYYGTSQGSLSTSLPVSSGLTAVVIENLQSGVTYYFTITSVNSLGVESDYSNIVSKTAI